MTCTIPRDAAIRLTSAQVVGCRTTQSQSTVHSQRSAKTTRRKALSLLGARGPRDAPNELTNGCRRSLGGVHQLRTPMGFPGTPQSKQIRARGSWCGTPRAQAGQLAQGSALPGAVGVEVSHLELRAPGGRGLDQKHTAGGDRPVTSKYLRVHQTLTLRSPLTLPLRPSDQDNFPTPFIKITVILKETFRNLSPPGSPP